MAFEFKREQSDIIESKDKNLIVSASAGSGKTTVMIERISQLIKNGNASPKNLLVLTYTTSAASEMKQKLYNNLRSKLSEKENCSQILDEISVSDISTIHSFCSRLIKKYFHILGVSPNFKIFGEGESVKIKNQIINNLLVEMAKENFEDYINLMNNFSTDRKHKNIIEIINKINIFSQSFKDRNDFKNTMIYLYENKEIAQEILNENLINKAKKIYDRAQQIIKTTNDLQIPKYTQYLNVTTSNLSKISKNNTFFANFCNFLDFSQPILKTDSNVDEKINLEIISIKKEISDIKAILNKKNYGDENTIKKSINNNFYITKLLLDLEGNFYIKYKEYKTKNNLFDYSDLEENAIFLCENKTVQTELKDIYKYVFIDEYQDANEIQDKLISLLCGENNRFMVGDVKQSIYGFRRSKPQIFLDIIKKYSSEKQSEARYLTLNFRSDVEILNFVNYVFCNIMTKETGGIDYKEKNKFNGEKKFESELPKVNILVIDKQNEKTSKEDKKICTGLYDIKSTQEEEILTESEQEACLVAKEILNLKNKKISDGKQLHEIKYSDITILTRKRSTGYKEFCDKLNSLGIPIYASTSSDIMENPESQKILNLLKTCVSINDDISLVSSLVSFFDFDESDLINIRLCFMQEKFFFECLKKYSEEKDDNLSTRIKDAYNEIENLQNDINVIGGFRAINKFFDKKEYFERLELQKNKIRIQIIKKILNEIKKEEYNFNIPLFIDYLENSGKVVLPDISSADSEFVNITTIHSSKGLEYPIVFIVDAGSDFNKTRQDPVFINDKLGFGMKYYDSETEESFNSVVCDAIKLANKKEEFAEKIRLLYVGLTRAKNMLYIVGNADLKSVNHIDDDQEIMEQNSFMKLVLSSFDNEVINKLRLVDNFVEKINDSNILFKKYDENEIIQARQPNKILFSKGDEKIEKLLIQRLEQKSNTNNVISLKNSVSSLLNAEEYENKVEIVEKLLTEEHLRGDSYSAEEGISYHKVLEILDYSDFQYTEKINEVVSNFGNVSVEKIQRVLAVLYNLFGENKVNKEKKFIMKVPYNEIVKSEIKDEILVQGIIDAFAIFDDNTAILVDYKLTKSKSNDKIKERYKKQIELYKLAIQKAYNPKKIVSYILNLQTCELINMD